MMQKAKGAAFKALHEREGAFIIPNPWDLGSAVLLETFGFEALATTSSGLAYSLGRRDGEVTLEEMLTHCRQLCDATELPVSADLENGYADDPKGVGEAVTRAAEAGLVGGSIEDYRGGADATIYDLELAVERVAAAVEAARALSFDFSLTARAENLIRGRMDLDDTTRRLQAFEAVGADILYAPGLTSLEQVKDVTSALKNPVNVLAPLIEGGTRDALAAVGAKRLSIGGALSRAALAPVLRAAAEMRDKGSFGWTADLAPSAEVERLFQTPKGR